MKVLLNYRKQRTYGRTDTHTQRERERERERANLHVSIEDFPIAQWIEPDAANLQVMVSISNCTSTCVMLHKESPIGHISHVWPVTMLNEFITDYYYYYY